MNLDAHPDDGRDQPVSNRVICPGLARLDEPIEMGGLLP